MNNTPIQIIINIIMFIAISLAITSMFMGKANAKANETTWNTGTHRLNQSIINMGVDSKLSSYIINKCKEKAKDPRKCVKTAVAIYGNESGFGTKCKSHSCWGVISKKYKSKTLAFDDWLKRYNKWWHKHTGGSYFYGGYGWKGPSGYCHSEVSSGSKLGCPNGTKTFNYFYNQL